MDKYSELLATVKVDYDILSKAHENMQKGLSFGSKDDYESEIIRAYESGEITEEQYEQLIVKEGKYRYEI